MVWADWEESYTLYFRLVFQKSKENSVFHNNLKGIVQTKNMIFWFIYFLVQLKSVVGFVTKILQNIFLHVPQNKVIWVWSKTFLGDIPKLHLQSRYLVLHDHVTRIIDHVSWREVDESPICLYEELVWSAFIAPWSYTQITCIRLGPHLQPGSVEVPLGDSHPTSTP